MDDFDKMVAEAMNAEDQQMLEDLQEQSFVAQSFGVMRGRNGWVGVVMLVVQFVLFIAGLWAGVHFFNAVEVLEALKWGLPAATLMIVATQIKMAMMPQIQADRVLRALRRLELMVVKAR